MFVFLISKDVKYFSFFCCLGCGELGIGINFLKNNLKIKIKIFSKVYKFYVVNFFLSSLF